MAGESQSLYRKYRPRSFDETELVGQEAVARTLRNAIQTGRVAHAYLFCGPRGTGKTTTARLLAKAVNCAHPDPARRPCNECQPCRTIGLGENRSLDIIEIDAASNRGIDDIRELRERINFSPSELTYKFYIIDEVHQLSEAAANALLKTLEEPPRHAKFVLATTDPQKMLETIVSRCQVFRFRRIPLDRMVARLRHVCVAEGLTIDDEALVLIARQATGSLRDALGLLDTVAAYGQDRLTVETVRQALGIHGDERVVELVDALLDRDLAAALTTVNAVVDEGFEPRRFTQQVVEYLRELLLRLAGGPNPAAGLAPLREAAQERQAARTSLAAVAEMTQRLSGIDYALERGAYGALPLELALAESLLGRATPPSQAAAASASAVAPPREIRPRPARSEPSAPTTMPPAEAAPPPAAVAPPPVAVAPPPAADDAAPPRAVAEASAPVPVAAPGDDGATDWLQEVWQRAMRDLNTRHKRLHALLRNADPLRLDGETLVLLAAYEFHYKQINQEATRALIEEAVERHAGRHFRVRCVLASEGEGPGPGQGPEPPAPMPAPLSPAAAPPLPSPTPSVVAAAPAPPPTDRPAPQPAEATPDPSDDQARLQAAINIFNARLV